MQFLKYLTEFNTASVALRLVLAVILGGVIGFERGRHGRAAGLRTHILVCVGAAMTSLTGIFGTNLLGGGDAFRISAQVISGIGFLGVGMILVRNRTVVTGLTTAAGLWATAAIGLSVGYGLYEAAFVTVLMVVIAFTIVSHLESLVTHKRQRMFVYLEVDSVESVRVMTDLLVEELGAKELQVTPPRSGTAPHVGIEALIRIPRKVTVEAKIRKLHKLDHVVFALPIN